MFGVPRTTLAPRTSTHARARGAGGGARRCGGRTGSRCEGETPSRGGDWLQHGARGQNKDDGFFPRPRGGRRWNMQKEGTCRRANTATCHFSVIESRTHPETRFSSPLITPPRHARRAARRSGAPPRVPTAQRRLRHATQPTRSAGARARRRRSDGRGFFRRCAPQVLLLSLSYGGSKCTRLRLGAPVPTQSEATGASAAHFETPPHHVPDRTRPLHARARICV